ncbi:MAG: hypothetical protein JNL98_35070 [Bryobacterales bacterium]|nr:hypothetical protein [Bryobacterales bacterium]
MTGLYAGENQSPEPEPVPDLMEVSSTCKFWIAQKNRSDRGRRAGYQSSKRAGSHRTEAKILRGWADHDQMAQRAGIGDEEAHRTLLPLSMQ